LQSNERLTSASPDLWQVILYSSRADRFEAYDLSMTKFLASILQQVIVSGIFPEDFPNPGAQFIPAAPSEVLRQL